MKNRIEELEEIVQGLVVKTKLQQSQIESLEAMCEQGFSFLMGKDERANLLSFYYEHVVSAENTHLVSLHKYIPQKAILKQQLPFEMIYHKKLRELKESLK